MKWRNWLAVVLCAVLLAGCGAPETAVEGEISFPGLRWGMTVEETQDALKYEEFTVLKERDDSGDENVHAHIWKEYEISVPGLELYAPAEEVRLCFRAYTRDAEPMLSSVTVVYSADTDAQAILAAVEEQYGPGEPHEYQPGLCWTGEYTTGSYMSEGYYLERLMELTESENPGNIANPATYLSFLSGLEGHELEVYGLKAGQCALEFFSAIPEYAQKDPAPLQSPVTERTAFCADGLLFFPGTMWGMTAGEVQAALHVTGEVSGNTMTVERAFAGYDAEVTFSFDTLFEGFEPGLVSAEVHFHKEPEGLEEKLTELLGPGQEGLWYGSRKTAAFLSERKWSWYVEFTGADPAEQPASTLSFSGNVLNLESTLALVYQMPDPYAEVKALFEEGVEDRWYQNALSCWYDDPTQIQLGELFGGMIGEDFTGPELETALEHYDMNTIRAVGNVRVTKEDMDAVLCKYFGITLEDCDLGTFDQTWMYCEETDAWLNLSVSGTGYLPEFTDAQTLENGDVRLTYDHSWKGPCAVTLRNADGQWQIVSHVVIVED